MVQVKWYKLTLDPILHGGRQAGLLALQYRSRKGQLTAGEDDEDSALVARVLEDLQMQRKSVITKPITTIVQFWRLPPSRWGCSVHTLIAPLNISAVHGPLSKAASGRDVP